LAITRFRQLNWQLLIVLMKVLLLHQLLLLLGLWLLLHG
jgi:hypothetical protein